MFPMAHFDIPEQKLWHSDMITNNREANIFILWF
jgi:hypothetical protein